MNRYQRTASLLLSLSLLSNAAAAQCATDAFEPNDVCQAATITPLGEHTGLTIDASDDDWYRFIVPNGRTVEVVRLSGGSASWSMTLYDGSCVGAPISTDGSFGQVTNASGSPKTYYLSLQVNSAACELYSLTLRELAGFENFCRGNGASTPGCTECPCGNNAPSTSNGGCLNASGGSALLAPAGFSSVGLPTLNFRLFGANPNTFAILISGSRRAPANPSHPCFGLGSGITGPIFDGLRCVTTDVQRHGTRATDSNGSVGITNNRWGPPSGPTGGLIAQGGFVAGQARFFQVVYRELPTAQCGTGQNTSQGIHVIIFP